MRMLAESGYRASRLCSGSCQRQDRASAPAFHRLIASAASLLRLAWRAEVAVSRPSTVRIDHDRARRGVNGAAGQRKKQQQGRSKSHGFERCVKTGVLASKVQGRYQVVQGPCRNKITLDQPLFKRFPTLLAAAGHFGVMAIAGYGIAARLDALLVPVVFGFGTAALTVVGTNLGAGKLARHCFNGPHDRPLLHRYPIRCLKFARHQQINRDVFLEAVLRVGSRASAQTWPKSHVLRSSGMRDAALPPEN